MATFDYGPRLSVSEFEKQIVDLYRSRPVEPTTAAEKDVARRELDLTVDFRLGSKFPQDRRDALWAIQQRVEKRRWRLMLHGLFHKLTDGSLHRRAGGLADYLVKEYAKVLSPEELEAYFDLAPTERLPRSPPLKS